MLSARPAPRARPDAGEKQRVLSARATSKTSGTDRKRYIDAENALRVRWRVVTGDWHAWVHAHAHALTSDPAASIEESALAIVTPMVAPPGLSTFKTTLTGLRSGISNLVTALMGLAPQTASSTSEADRAAATHRAQVLFDQVEGKLHGLHGTVGQELAQLAMQERLLTQDLEALATRIRGWETESVASADTPPLRTLRTGPTPATTSDQSSPEIRAYNDYLAHSGGRTGGWDATSHDLFMQAWRQSKLPTHPPYPFDVSAFESDLESDDGPGIVRAFLHKAHALTAQSMDAIARHTAWYMQLQVLDAAKRAAVAGWRARTAAAVSVSSLDDATAAAAEDAQEGPSRPMTDGSVARERQMAQVLAWRIEREQREMAEQRRRAQEERDREERERRVWERRQDRLKRIVQEHKRRSESPSPVLRHEEGQVSALPRLPSPTVMARIAHRTEAMLEERHRRVRAASASSLPPQLPTPPRSAFPTVTRDPERAQAPTMASRRAGSAQARTDDRTARSVHDRFAVTVGARALPRRTVPVWRQAVG